MIFVHFLPFLFSPIPLIPFMVLKNFRGLASCSSNLSLTNSSFATASSFFYFIFLSPENFPVFFRWEFLSFIEEEVFLIDFTYHVFSWGVSSLIFMSLRGAWKLEFFFFVFFLFSVFTSHDSALHRWSSIYVLGNIEH